jgi:hypothetical protein
VPRRAARVGGRRRRREPRLRRGFRPLTAGHHRGGAACDGGAMLWLTWCGAVRVFVGEPV